MSDRCKTCKAEIRWAIWVDSGRTVPLDLEPAENGNVALVDPRVPGSAPGAVVIPEARRGRYAGSLYVSHFATCPDADEHRRQR
jgi:hypothetical protein